MKDTNMCLSSLCLLGSPFICFDRTRKRQLPSGIAGSTFLPYIVKKPVIGEVCISDSSIETSIAKSAYYH